MSTIPAICPVCGQRHAPVGGGAGTVPAFACPGPRVLRDGRLVSWGPVLYPPWPDEEAGP